MITTMKMIDKTSNDVHYILERGRPSRTIEVAVLYRRACHTDHDIVDAQQEITVYTGCKNFSIVDLSDIRSD